MLRGAAPGCHQGSAGCCHGRCHFTHSLRPVLTTAPPQHPGISSSIAGVLHLALHATFGK